MFCRHLIVALSLLACASPAPGDDDLFRVHAADWVDDGAEDSSLPFGHNPADWTDELQLTSASMQYGRGDVPEVVGEYYYYPPGTMPDESCIDWLLPRSELPLPLMQSLVEGRDVTLPLPLGTSGIWTELDRHVAVSNVRLGLGTNPPVPVNRVEVPETTFHASTQVARIDLWVLPFLNIYGIVGHTRSTGDVAVTVDPSPIAPPGSVVLDIPVDLRGTTAGYGITGGIGAKDWFAMLDFNQTWTNFSQLDSELTALVITPRVGLVIDQPWFQGEVHVGAMWQDTAQTVELTIDHPLLGNGLRVEVDQFEPNPWNFLVGGMWALDERVQLLVEGGMGGRSYILGGVTVRY